MQPEDINKVTELTQQLLQAPLNNLALFIAVLALFVLLGSLYIAYRLSPRIVKFLESLTVSYSKMVDNLEKLTAVETQNTAMQASVNDTLGGINNNINVLLTEGSIPVKRIDANTQKLLSEGSAPSALILQAVQNVHIILTDLSPVIKALPDQKQMTEMTHLIAQVRGYAERMALKATREMQAVKVDGVHPPESSSQTDKENGQ